MNITDNLLIRRNTTRRLLCVALYIALPVVAWAQWSTSSNDIYNSNSGNIGIGETSPVVKLHISQSSSNASFATIALADIGIIVQNKDTTTNNLSLMAFVDGSTASTGLIGTINQNGSSQLGHLVFLTRPSTGQPFLERMRISNTGGVGIGTTTPLSALDVNGTITSRGNGGNFRLSVEDGSQGQWAYDGSANTYFDFAQTLRVRSLTGGTSDRLTILSSGNVGVGTTSPSSKLEVNGNVTVSGDVTASGNIAAKYQDIAEWVPSRHVIEAGSVVVLDMSQSNAVAVSSTPYDTRVAGVVSAKPGIILGEEAQGKVKVATTGRVKVRVDARGGAIAIGDLLVTSDRPGMAMRSAPVSFGGIEIHRPGTIVGKALEALPEGEGEILVLLSMQ